MKNEKKVVQKSNHAIHKSGKCVVFFIHTVKRHRVPLPAKMRSSVLAKVNMYPLSEYINVTNSLSSLIVTAVIFFAN